MATSDVGLTLHNRLTHVLEVAQIGRRLAQKLKKLATQNDDFVQYADCIDPEIVELACLAHDLGHPPFGHLAEEVLDEEARRHNVSDGFEGNAQSFRVVTKLAIKSDKYDGLNLCRAALNALLKYPWMRATSGKHSRKWGAYSTEKTEFDFARKLAGISEFKSVEAEIMDWADDIAYSVHDLEDFYKAGKIPLDRLVRDRDERKEFCQQVFKNWRDREQHDGEKMDDYEQAFDTLVEHTVFSVERPFCGGRAQYSKLRGLASFLITRYTEAIKLIKPTQAHDSFIEIDRCYRLEIAMLKELTWQYVIRDPSLATQQYGQRQIIKDLFNVFFKASEDSSQWHVFPQQSREQLESSRAAHKTGKEDRVRAVLDLIAGMSEQQAVGMHHRLKGIVPGQSLEKIL